MTRTLFCSLVVLTVFGSMACAPRRNRVEHLDVPNTAPIIVCEPTLNFEVGCFEADGLCCDWRDEESIEDVCEEAFAGSEPFVCTDREQPLISETMECVLVDINTKCVWGQSQIACCR